jgi:hypothetical protein
MDCELAHREVAQDEQIVFDVVGQAFVEGAVGPDAAGLVKADRRRSGAANTLRLLAGSVISAEPRMGLRMEVAAFQPY